MDGGRTWSAIQIGPCLCCRLNGGGHSLLRVNEPPHSKLLRDGWGDGIRSLTNREQVGAHLIPLTKRQSAGGKEAADFHGIPAKHILKHRNEHAHGIVAEYGTASHTGDEFGFRDGNGQTVMLVHVHHYRQVGTAVAHVDDVVVADAEMSAQLYQDSNFAPAGRGSDDGFHFARGFIETESRAVDVLFGNDSFERRLNNFLRRGGNNVERNSEIVGEVVERVREELHVVLQTDALPGLDQVLATNATEIGVMQDEVRKFSTLLNQIDIGQAFHLLVERVKAD